ncbi:hypothetical protein Bca101_101217 [Brassica carinata]
MSVGDFRLRGLSVGDFRPRGLSVSTHNSTFTLPVDCPGAFRPRGQYISTHIGTLALPVDCSGDFRPRGLSVSRQLCTDGKSTWTVWVIFAHEDCPLVHISARWPFPWTVFGQLTHVDSPSVHISRSERRSRTDLANDTRLWEPAPTEGRQSAAGACAASSPDSDLEALSHNPAHGSFATGFSTKRDDQLCESTTPALSFNRCAAQPNSPPDNVLRSIDREASLGSKRRGCYPPPIHGSDSLVRFSSELAVRRRESSRRAAPSPPPPTRGGPLATLAAQAARQQSTGSNWDPEPSPQSQSFSGYGSILPTSLPTLFHRPEAVHLGDLMRYEYDRGVSALGPPDFQGPECTDTTRRGGALPAAGPYLR